MWLRRRIWSVSYYSLVWLLTEEENMVSISLLLASLHWLPIDARITYKLACICYHCMSTNSPPYLSDLLTVYTAARQLRSCSDNSVVLLSVQYPMVKDLSHTPPLLLGTLFLSRSTLLILSLPSVPELKFTFSVLPINSLNLSFVLVSVTVTMF